MPEGTIYKAMSGFYYVKADGFNTGKPAYSNLSSCLVMCVARGRFRHSKDTPLVGDKVIFNVTEPGKGVLSQILPRRNSFVRPPIANIDKMVIVASKATPVTDPYLIDKMTVIALHNNCEPIVCINKLDIDDADDLYNIYETSKIPVVKTSALTGAGISELISHITGTQCAFSGNSGVGKSSILNAIEPDFDIKTGDVSSKLGRGRHTTRHVELYEISCGAVIADTPGFSAFDTSHIADKENIQFLFPEFEEFLGNCRFDDCAHISEPGCAVLEAVSNGIIHPSRHESYVRLYKQAAEHKNWETI